MYGSLFTIYEGPPSTHKDEFRFQSNSETVDTFR